MQVNSIAGTVTNWVFFPMSLSFRQLSSTSSKTQFIFKSHLLQFPVNWKGWRRGRVCDRARVWIKPWECPLRPGAWLLFSPQAALWKNSRSKIKARHQPAWLPEPWHCWGKENSTEIILNVLRCMQLSERPVCQQRELVPGGLPGPIWVRIIVTRSWGGEQQASKEERPPVHPRLFDGPLCADTGPHLLVLTNISFNGGCYNS